MRVAVTGATGFIGRYIVQHLVSQGHALRCWHRPSSHREGFEEIADLKWIEGELGDGARYPGRRALSGVPTPARHAPEPAVAQTGS